MPKPKVIVFTTAYHPFIGGAEIAIQEVARRLKDRFDFYPVRSKPPQAAAAVPLEAGGRTSNGIYIVTARFRRDLPKREIRPEGTIFRVGVGISFDKWLLPFLAIWNLEFGIWNFPKRRAVLWAVDIGQGALAAAIYKLFHPKTPFIFNVQYGYGEDRLARGRWGAIGLAFRFILSRADYVTAISTHLLDLARRYGYRGPAEVVHNGVAVEKFQNTNPKSQTKHKAQSTKHKTIITTSRLVPKNGTDILIRAIAEIKKTIPDIRCHIIGDGPERENLKFKVKSLKLEENVKFFGEIPHEKIPEYLHQADVFVRPSRSEGMGNSFVEALAAGLPIIGTPVGGITDIIEDGKTGVFCKVDDPADLAQKIIRLLQDRNLARKIAENGRKMAEERFSWDRIASSYERLFQNVQHRVLDILLATGLFPPDIGGPATYSKILLEELPKRGIRVEILPFREVRHLPKVIRHAAYFLKILRRAKSADIIFAQDPVSVGFPSALAAKILRKRFLLKIVGDYAWEQGVQRFGVAEFLDDFLDKSYGWKVEILRKIQKFVACRANKIIVPSKYLQGVISRWGIAWQKINVIYNSSEPAVVEVSKNEARKNLGLSGKIILSSGRLVQWKGFETLIDTMPQILQNIPDAKLLIIGSGPEEQKLKIKIEKFHLEDRIKIIGQVPRREILQYLKAADVFALNTGYEGFSHLLLEAMAVGTPIVTTKICGNPELIKHGENGLLAGYNQVEEFKHALVDVLTNKDLAFRLSNKAKEAVKNFSKEKMIEETVKILKSL